MRAIHIACISCSESGEPYCIKNKIKEEAERQKKIDSGKEGINTEFNLAVRVLADNERYFNDRLLLYNNIFIYNDG